MTTYIILGAVWGGVIVSVWGDIVRYNGEERKGRVLLRNGVAWTIAHTLILLTILALKVG